MLRTDCIKDLAVNIEIGCKFNFHPRYNLVFFTRYEVAGISSAVNVNSLLTMCLTLVRSKLNTLLSHELHIEYAVQRRKFAAFAATDYFINIQKQTP
jgi:hypothetical protein